MRGLKTEKALLIWHFCSEIPIGIIKKTKYIKLLLGLQCCLENMSLIYLMEKQMGMDWASHIFLRDAVTLCLPLLIMAAN